MKKALLLLILITCTLSYSQKKILKTNLINGGITIDGNLNETSWQTAAIAKDFFMFAPDNGKEVEKGNETEVKILYDNEAIYIGAILYDDEPSKILKELTLRDDQGTSDNFGVFINGFNDGQQDFRFFCTASGTQMDCLATDTTKRKFAFVNFSKALWSPALIRCANSTSSSAVIKSTLPISCKYLSNEAVSRLVTCLVILSCLIEFPPQFLCSICYTYEKLKSYKLS